MSKHICIGVARSALIGGNSGSCYVLGEGGTAQVGRWIVINLNHAMVDIGVNVWPCRSQVESLAVFPDWLHRDNHPRGGVPV